MKTISQQLRARANHRHTISLDEEGARKALRIMEADHELMRSAAQTIERLIIGDVLKDGLDRLPPV